MMVNVSIKMIMFLKNVLIYLQNVNKLLFV